METWNYVRIVVNVISVACQKSLVEENVIKVERRQVPLPVWFPLTAKECLKIDVLHFGKPIVDRHPVRRRNVGNHCNVNQGDLSIQQAI